METNETLADLHSEHADWQNRIASFKDEIKNMSDRLGSVVSKLAPRDVPSNVEHFQNQFILQRDVLDIMRHDFKQYENMIEDEQTKSKAASNEVSQLRKAYQVRLDDFGRIFNELKGHFNLFVKEEAITA